MISCCVLTFLRRSEALLSSSILRSEHLFVSSFDAVWSPEYLLLVTLRIHKIGCMLVRKGANVKVPPAISTRFAPFRFRSANFARLASNVTSCDRSSPACEAIHGETRVETCCLVCTSRRQRDTAGAFGPGAAVRDRTSGVRLNLMHVVFFPAVLRQPARIG